MRRRRPLASLLLALAAAAPAAAQSGPFARFLGGGPPRTDCMLVTDVGGATGAHAARCTDGDPSCDADGVADGTCVLSVRLCLDAVDPSAPRCHADVVTEADSTLPVLDAALAALGMPVATAETCTEPVPVAVPRRGRRGRLVLHATARMVSGHADRDRLTLVCRRPTGSAATFATLQQRIFTPACAIPSCHGAAASGGLTLTAGASYAQLVGVAATNPAAQAAGALRVVPGDPDRSFLIRKLEGPLAAGEGDPMPRVGTRLSPALLDLVRRWIVAGAPADTAF